MATIVTEDGREIDVGIAHFETFHNDHVCRATKVWLRCPADEGRPRLELDGLAICGPEDQFSRKAGRNLARKRFLAKFEGEANLHSIFNSRYPKNKKEPYSLKEIYFTREDRRQIYRVLLPEYHMNVPREKRDLKQGAKPEAVKEQPVEKVPSTSVTLVRDNEEICFQGK